MRAHLVLKLQTTSTLIEHAEDLVQSSQKNQDRALSLGAVKLLSLYTRDHVIIK